MVVDVIDDDTVVRDVLVAVAVVTVVVVGSPCPQFQVDGKHCLVPGTYGKHSPSTSQMQGPVVPMVQPLQTTGAAEGANDARVVVLTVVCDVEVSVTDVAVLVMVAEVPVVVLVTVVSVDVDVLVADVAVIVVVVVGSEHLWVPV